MADNRNCETAVGDIPTLAKGDLVFARIYTYGVFLCRIARVVKYKISDGPDYWVDIEGNAKGHRRHQGIRQKDILRRADEQIQLL